MKTGFIFDQFLCVGCNACSAACILEHGWLTHPRKIKTYNKDAFGIAPVVNVSMACNHCENAPCLAGCPASAIMRTATGAVLIDKEKCLGCKLCGWYCPYEAPAFNDTEKVMEKCTLCFSEEDQFKVPVCANACPTGALNFSETGANINFPVADWFTDRNCGPRFEFVTETVTAPLRIIPSRNSDKSERNLSDDRSAVKEISLVLFSFLSVLSVSWFITGFFTSSYPQTLQFIGLLPVIAFISLFHLGKKMRAWRAISNISRSPLSREILLFLLYSATSSSAVLLKIPVLTITASVLGLLFLTSIDLIYFNAATEKNIKLHSGQALLSGLLIISYFSKSPAPFVIIAGIKTLLILIAFFSYKRSREYTGLVFLRLFMLLLPAYSFFTKRADNDIIMSLIFLIGEFADRIMFYSDFIPSGILSAMEKHIKSQYNER